MRIKGSLLAPAPKGPLYFPAKAVATMWHNLCVELISWRRLVAVVFAWLICRWRGYNDAAWAFTITAFCLGLFLGAENTTNGRLKVPFLSGHHHRHLIHHWPVGSGSNRRPFGVDAHLNCPARAPRHGASPRSKPSLQRSLSLSPSI